MSFPAVPVTHPSCSVKQQQDLKILCCRCHNITHASLFQLQACSWSLKEELQATMYVSQCDGARSYRMITILREMVLFPALSLLK